MARRSPKTRPLGQPYEARSPLYRHEPHPHQPRHPDEARRAHRAELRAQGGWRARLALFNELLAANITAGVGTMYTAYAFTVLAATGVPGSHATLHDWVQWFSQTFLQLVMLPILAVGTAVLGRAAATQAIEMYKNVLRILHDLGQVMKHLDVQDIEVFRRLDMQDAALERQTDMILRIAAKLALENAAATTPAETSVNPASPDTHTTRPRSDAAATSPASPPSPAPVAATPAQTPAPRAASTPHAASPSTSSVSTRSARRGAPASGQRRRDYQTSNR